MTAATATPATPAPRERRRPWVAPPGGRPIALYPVVLAGLVVVELFVSSGVSPLEMIRSLVVAIGLGLALVVLGRVLLGDAHRGGIFAAFALLLVVAGADLRLAAVVAAAIGLLFVERYALAPERRTIRWSFIGRFFSRLTAVLVLAVAIQAVQAGTPEVLARTATREAPFGGAGVVAAAAQTNPPHPDIYVILADGHARADVLADYFGYDESAFSAGLADRGLHVATKARTNYAITAEVLASMFNMRPLQDIPSLGPLLAGSATRPAGVLVREALNDGPALQRLRDEGYSVTATASSFAEPTLRQVDTWIDTGQLNEFEVNLLRRSVFRPIIAAVAPDLVTSQYRQRTVDTLAAAATIAGTRSASPRFVFVHVPSPHPPWVVNADGSPRAIADVDSIFGETTPSTGLDIDALKRGYTGQVAWLDRELLSTIDAIDAASSTPPAIVVFGDHGSWVGADGDDIRRRFRPLFAARVPDGAAIYPDDVALVDTFPILFDHLFGGTTPRHEDAPSWMFRVPAEYDLFPIGDPNATEPAP